VAALPELALQVKEPLVARQPVLLVVKQQAVEQVELAAEQQEALELLPEQAVVQEHLLF
jgi:hypothetical protein